MSPIIQSLANGSAYGYGMFVPAGAAGAFESIASASGTGSSGTITFSSIPQTYSSLHLRAITRQSTGTTGYGNFYIRLSTGGFTAEYANHYLQGNGSAASAVGSSGNTIIGNIKCADNGAAAGTMGVLLIDLHDYTSTTRNKTLRMVNAFEDNNVSGGAAIQLASALRVNTAAVDTLTFVLHSGSWTTNTTFALYGIKGA